MHIITVVGLGAGDLEQLSVGTYRKLKEASLMIARTEQHPVIQELKEEGIQIESFDDFYERNDAFENVYAQIVEALLQRSEKEEITYIVP